MQNFSYLRVMSMGGDFFSKHDSAWQCFFHHYLGCSSTIFSQILVCCSGDYGLSKMWSQIFTQMSETWSNFQFQNDISKYSETKFLPVGWRHRLQIARNDVYKSLLFFLSVWILCSRYLKNGNSNHLQIFTVSLPWSGMDTITFSAWSPNHDVI